jgi:predicted HAD superfamily Cof-like phosphohydrolase
VDTVVTQIAAEPTWDIQTLPLDLGLTGNVVTLAAVRSARTVRRMTSAKKLKRAASDCSDALFMVADFHSAFDLPMASQPTTSVPDELRQLRVDLLVEEVREFAEATDAKDIIGLADALADILYVTYGAAVTYGIDLDAVVREVHRSNMSKLDENGQPVLREDGKVLKSARYTRPDVVTVLGKQQPLPF